MTRNERDLLDLCSELIEAVYITDYELAHVFTLRLNIIWKELADVD